MKGFNITYTVIAILFSALTLNAQNTFFVNQTGTGQGTLLAMNGIAANGADGAGGVSEVPEPTSIALLGIGCFGIAVSRRRKRS